MSRYIDIEPYEKDGWYLQKRYRNEHCEVVKTTPLISVPTAEPVIRCKDCKYNYANMIPSGKGCQRNVYIEVDDNFFCANGERDDEVEE